jgi:hypothetical protein
MSFANMEISGRLDDEMLEDTGDLPSAPSSFTRRT